jgi:hypothetical protein
MDSSSGWKLGAFASAMVASLLMSGCLVGESSSPGSSNDGVSSPGAGSPQSITTPTVRADGLITTVTVVDRDSLPLANRVVTFGHVFVTGHVTRGVVAALNGSALPTQVDVKRRHADGSVRHAILSVTLPASLSSARAALELRQAGTMPEPGAGLTAAAVLSAGFDMILEVTEDGVVYRASAAELIRSRTERWLDGGIATELRVNGPLRASSASHPVFEAMFDVRFTAPGSARVAVVFENALANTVRGERTASFRILDNRGTELFSHANVYVPRHARFRKVFDWGSGRPSRLHVAPQLSYWVGSGAVPRYDLSKTLDPQAITDVEALASAGLNEIFGNGPITSYMPTTGGRADIGPLPQWAAVSLYTGDPRATDVMLAGGEYSGSFPIHLRDPLTRKAYSIDRHPTVSDGWWGNAYSTAADSLPACGTRCPTKDGLAADDVRRLTPAIYNRIHQVDTAHHPSVAYLPYLLTGDPYFLDEMVFWASYNFLSMSPQYRSGSLGLFKDEQVRGQAWSMRTLAQAAWVTPDAMAEERSYFEAKLAANLDWYNRNGVNSNPFGIWGDISNVVLDGGRPQASMANTVRSFTSPWQIDYFITALDYIAAMGYADARPFRDWLSKFPVARFSGTEWPRADATAYQIATRSIPADCGLLANPQTFNGCPTVFPLYASLAEMHQASFANRNAADEFWRAPTCAICYEANARAALASAARAGIPNARAAYDRLNTDILAAVATLGRDAYLRDPTWLITP